MIIIGFLASFSTARRVGMAHQLHSGEIRKCGPRPPYRDSMLPNFFHIFFGQRFDTMFDRLQMKFRLLGRFVQ